MEIFYISPGMLMAVLVNAESSFCSGGPAPLFEIQGRLLDSGLVLQLSHSLRIHVARTGVTV